MLLTKIHEDIVARFARLVTAGRLAHAYLFIGPAGMGKMQAALAIAQMVNCDVPPSSGNKQSPCGVCVSCRKIASGNHPDIHVMAALKDETTIKIEQARQMMQHASLKAYEAKVKVFIICDIDLMTREAANSLLKTLEEPAANTLMIFTTQVPEACLDTIRSRCHIVKFFCAEDRLPQDKDRFLNAFLSRTNQEEFLKVLSADKKQAGQTMVVLLAWLRDVMLYKSGIVAHALIHQDRLADFKKMAQRGMGDLSVLSEQIVHTKSLADENLNVKMALSLVRERLWGN